VIVVIGVLVSIFTLSIGGFMEDDGEEDARRLETLIQLASEEASMQGREIGLTFYQHGYEFSVLGTAEDKDGKTVQQWAPLQDDRLLKPRDLGSALAVDLELEGRDTTLLYERDTEATYEPQIYLLSSGDIEPPFSARIRPQFANQGFLLQADVDGAVEFVVEGVDDAG